MRLTTTLYGNVEKQEKPEIQEQQLSLDGAHEGNCNKPGSRLEKHKLLFYKRACGRESSIIHSTT